MLSRRCALTASASTSRNRVPRMRSAAPKRSRNLMPASSRAALHRGRLRWPSAERRCRNRPEAAVANYALPPRSTPGAKFENALAADIPARQKSGRRRRSAPLKKQLRRGTRPKRQVQRAGNGHDLQPDRFRRRAADRLESQPPSRPRASRASQIAVAYHLRPQRRPALRNGRAHNMVNKQQLTRTPPPAAGS